MSQENLILKPIRRVSPSRYTAMRSCLLREVWTAAGNEPLLPPSPSAELGTVIHELLAVAGRGELEGGGKERIEQAWLALVSLAEERMALSALRRHQVPLSRSISDYEVKRLRAFHRAAEIAAASARGRVEHPRKRSEQTGFELWVQSRDGQIGGYIDRASMTPAGVVLSDYKSCAVLNSSNPDAPGVIKQAYQDQLMLYAALYHIASGNWPVRLEVVPIQGAPREIAYKQAAAEHLLTEASAFVLNANRQIAEVLTGNAGINGLAFPHPAHCMHCLFRPACRAYWPARRREPRMKWPVDVRGSVDGISRLRNGRLCMLIAQGEPSTPSCATVRNLTDDNYRHPLLRQMEQGTMVAICCLSRQYRSGDYIESHDTVISFSEGD